MVTVPAFIDDIPGNRHAFDRLRELLASSKAIGFVGAGASAGLYPLWGGLLDRLMDEAARRNRGTEEDREVWREIAAKDARQGASALFAALGPAEFGAIIRDTFRPDPNGDGVRHTETHLAIARLPFRALVTTNYDPCLIEARLAAAGRPLSEPVVWDEIDEIRRWYRDEAFVADDVPLLFAHGTYRRSDSIVLTAEQYQCVYHGTLYRELFGSLWGQDNLVFVGFGFSDPFLDFLAEEIVTKVGGAPAHIALIGRDADKPVTSTISHFFARKYGLTPLFYPVRNHDHSALLEVLRALRDGLPAKSSHTVPQTLRQILYDLPDLPLRYQERTDALARLREALLAGSGAPHHGIVSRSRIAGVLGMGGIGKTVLATGIVHDQKVREAFPDGIFWLGFGRNVDVTAKQAELAKALGSPAEVFKDWQEGRARLGQLTAEGGRLIVLDDVWEPHAAEAFTRLGPGCRLVVTSRDARVLEKAGAVRHQLDELLPEAALALLAEAADATVEALPPEATTIVSECGNLPLALQSAGALIRTGHYGWAELLDRLHHADIEQLRAALPDYDREGVLAALQVSVEALGNHERECFLDLAVFSEGLDIPETPILRLWSDRLSHPEKARATLQRLVELNLLRRDKSRHYRLHDLYFDYLQNAAAPKASRHKRLIEAYRHTDGWHALDDGYIVRWVARHLDKAGLQEELTSLLFDLQWIHRVIREGKLGALLADLGRLSDFAEAAEFSSALRMSAHILARHPEQIAAQIRGRTNTTAYEHLSVLVDSAKREIPIEILVPRFDGYLLKTGNLIATIKAHAEPVHALAITPDQKYIISGSWDQTLRVWDMESRNLEHSIEGHPSGINTIAVTRDGNMLMAGWDGSICL